MLYAIVPAASGDEPKVANGGDVWVLVIRNSKPSDSGIYVCEVNSNPIVRSFHKLSGRSIMLLKNQFFSQQICSTK